MIIEGVSIPSPSLEVNLLLATAFEVEADVVSQWLGFHSTILLKRGEFHPHTQRVAITQFHRHRYGVILLRSDVDTIDVNAETSLIGALQLLDGLNANAIARTVIDHNLLRSRWYLGKDGVKAQGFIGYGEDVVGRCRKRIVVITT